MRASRGTCVVGGEASVREDVVRDQAGGDVVPPRPVVAHDDGDLLQEVRDLKSLRS